MTNKEKDKQINVDKVKHVPTLKTNIYNPKIYCWVVVKTDRLCTLNSVVLGKLPIGAVEMTNKTNYQTERRTDRKTGRKLKINRTLIKIIPMQSYIVE